ncbi:MAG: hypothetical protein KGH69_00110 [Candidatus Micrarchaeota archaeon]|nr:hypothetical protein [Candidatus Micrarchaeota archaeon]
MGIERELGSPAAYACSSGADTQEMVGETRKLSKGGSFILLLDSRKGIHERLLPAYLNAYLRHKEKGMKSGSLQMEVLLFTAMTMQISDAIKSHGIKDRKGFIAFTNRKRLFRCFQRKFKVRASKELKLRLASDDSGRIATLPLRYVK